MPRENQSLLIVQCGKVVMATPVQALSIKGYCHAEPVGHHRPSRGASPHLIAVAVGRCNSQIMPIRGGFTGAPDDFLDMDVRVSVGPL